jgi:hypothetical protein
MTAHGANSPLATDEVAACTTDLGPSGKGWGEGGTGVPRASARLVAKI